MNKTGETRSCSAGDKLPESTREIDSTLLGRLFETVLGSGSTGVSGISPGNNLRSRLPGNNLRSRLPGMLVRNVCILRWGILRFAGDTHLP